MHLPTILLGTAAVVLAISAATSPPPQHVGLESTEFEQKVLKGVENCNIFAYKPCKDRKASSCDALLNQPGECDPYWGEVVKRIITIHG
jgi:hypothetical protein